MSASRPLLITASLAVALALCAGAMPILAHHSFGRYDMSKTASIEGTVNKFEWSNPHCWLFVDVPEEGKAITYGFEMTSVGEMLRRGWTKTSLRPGDKVKVSFRPMRDGTPAGLHMTTDREGALVGKPIRAPGAADSPRPGEGGNLD